MGRGNWFATKPNGTNGTNASEAPLVYVCIVEARECSEGQDEEFYNNMWEQFVQDIGDNLPKSFHIADVWDKKDFASCRDTSPLFSNNLCYVVTEAGGEYYHHGLSIIRREDAPAFADVYINKLAKRLFEKLATMYTLSVRTSAWTSDPYYIQPQKEKVK